MSQRRNYGFERRRKADVRRAKQDEKRQRRADREKTGHVGPEMGEAPDTGARPDTWEWFSPSRTRTLATAIGSRPATEPPDDWILLSDMGADSTESGTGSAAGDLD